MVFCTKQLLILNFNFKKNRFKTLIAQNVVIKINKNTVLEQELNVIKTQNGDNNSNNNIGSRLLLPILNITRQNSIQSKFEIYFFDGAPY